jgi:glycosyltransferase involved in cell wall biosynthesis
VRLPTVTVLLPAYNAAHWLEAALVSILQQTYVDFELLLMDDGSTDSTAAILRKYKDPRLSIMRAASNRGLIATLNNGIQLAKGRYIARMDADDIAHPRRLQLQVSFLQRHWEVGICGTWYRTMDADNRTSVRPPVTHDEISAQLFFRSPFGHPTVMIRRDVLADGLLYDVQSRHAEDFDLWVRARPKTRFANLPHFLLEYRTHSNQVSQEQRHLQRQSADKVRLRQLAQLVPEASAREQKLHLYICDEDHRFNNSTELKEAGTWLSTLWTCNSTNPMFAPNAFGNALERLWYECCLRSNLSREDRLNDYVSKKYRSPSFVRFRNRAILSYRRFVGAPDV